MSAVVLVALVNPKSGGNVGSQLLERFKEILDEDKIYNLSNGGPKKALEDHGHKENLRLIGEDNVFNSQYFWKWTNANPMKIFRQPASHPKLLFGSKLSLD